MRISFWLIKEKQKDPLWRVLVLRLKLQSKFSKVDKIVKKLIKKKRISSFSTIPQAQKYRTYRPDLQNCMGTFTPISRRRISRAWVGHDKEW